jgi:hypothetical protein
METLGSALRADEPALGSMTRASLANLPEKAQALGPLRQRGSGTG